MALLQDLRADMLHIIQIIYTGTFKNIFTKRPAGKYYPKILIGDLQCTEQ